MHIWYIASNVTLKYNTESVFYSEKLCFEVHSLILLYIPGTLIHLAVMILIVVVVALKMVVLISV
jgi:hypothetical protein